MMQGGLRERIGSLDGREKVGLAVIGTLAVAGAVVWYLRSLPSAVHVDEVRSAGSVVGTAGPGGAGGPRPGPSSTPAEIVVDVAGRVRHPGVYTFHQGDRVVDAIARAGGALPGSDLTSLNLAALLTDSEQIVVGRAGGGGAVSGTSSGDGSSGAGSPGAKVNVNTATVDQLVALPGIGPVLAQRIITYREQHGPFRSVRDLLNVPGIGDAHMADLEPLVTV